MATSNAKIPVVRGFFLSNKIVETAMVIFQWLRGIVVNSLFILTILAISIPIVIMAIIKLIVPHKGLAAVISRCGDKLANSWIVINNLQQKCLLPTKLTITGDVKVSPDEWYMLVSNHQCWSDILVIVRTFGTSISAVKFFFKQSLLWVPILGITLWGLDFPYMRRYSKQKLARHPELKGKDVEQTRRACEQFRSHPVTIINFLEGTRFTPVKHAAQESRYKYLLNPRAGGIAFTLHAMNGQLHQLLDVTILYPDGIPRYWDYVCGRVKRIHVHVRQLPIAPERVGDYSNDQQFRAEFQEWVNELWEEKNARLALMRKAAQVD